MADVHRSVQGGDLEGVKRAIAADSSALNVIGPGGQSPLMHAVLGACESHALCVTVCSHRRKD